MFVFMLNIVSLYDFTESWGEIQFWVLILFVMADLSWHDISVLYLYFNVCPEEKKLK